MGESNSISNVKRGFYTALTAGFLGFGAIYGCSEDSPTGLVIKIEPEPNPPTIELSVSPSSGISPLETYVLGKCEDLDNDIADYRVMKGSSILTRTNPTDTTITLGAGNYSFYSKCGDEKGNEVTSDTSYVEVRPNQPPQTTLSIDTTSGVVPLNVKVQYGCEDLDGPDDIAQSYVAVGRDTVTTTSIDSTFTFTEPGTYTTSGYCRDKVGAESTAGPIDIEATPEKIISQTAELTNYVDINYTATLTNVSEATRNFYHNGDSINTKTITTSNYSETFEESLKGDHMFILGAEGVKPDTARVNVPDYASKAPDLSELNLDVNERDSIIVHLKRAEDNNKEDNPVRYISVAPIGVNASLGVFPNDTVLTINASEIPGPDPFSYLIGLMREGSLDTINLEGRVLDIPRPAPDQIAVASGGCIVVGGDPTTKPCGDSEIFIIDEDGKNPRRLTYNDKAIDGTFTQDVNPNWSPDGTKIIYTSYRPWDEGGVAIWEVDLNGNENRLFGGLEMGLVDLDASPWSSGHVMYPSYSSDGTKIAFTYLKIRENSGEDRYGIAIWNGGDSFDFLTSDLCPRCFASGKPSWSPDGSRIVFGRTDRTDRLDYEDGLNDIWIMNSDGTGQEKIYSNNSHNIHPDWSPDGLHIAFTSSPGGGGHYDPRYLYTIKLDDRSVTQITDNPDARDYLPDWSPDGSKIVFLRGSRCIRIPLSCEGGPRMKVINLNTGEITQPIKQPPMSWQPGEYLIWPRTTEGFAWRPRQ